MQLLLGNALIIADGDVAAGHDFGQLRVVAFALARVGVHAVIGGGQVAAAVYRDVLDVHRTMMRPKR